MSDNPENPLWWVDFIEGEMPPKERDEKRLMLKHSSTDRLIVKNLLKLREIMQKHDPVLLPDSESYYDDLQEKIMNQIEALEVPQSQDATAK